MKRSGHHNSLMTSAEQEYLKQIYLYTAGNNKKIHTKELAFLVKTSPASVSDMVKRLASKKLIIYSRYYGYGLSKKGLLEALQITRRHRLWELFLAEKLGIDWKEIHSIASHLQSIESKDLVEKLSAYLGHPTYDPHGEVIPDKKGRIHKADYLEMYDLKINHAATIFGYRDTSKTFLAYMEKLQLLIGASIRVISIIDYDDSLELQVAGKYRHIISKETAQKIYVTVNKTSEPK